MTKTISIPAELLPDVLELVTDAYVKLAYSHEKTRELVSDLEFRNNELKNRNEHLEKECARLEAIKEKF